MTDEEKRFRWHIDEVREAIRLDWANLTSKNLTPDKRKAIREHLEMCSSALRDLVELTSVPRGMTLSSVKTQTKEHLHE